MPPPPEHVLDTSDNLVRELGLRYPDRPMHAAAALAVTLGRLAGGCGLDLVALVAVARTTAQACEESAA